MNNMRGVAYNVVLPCCRWVAVFFYSNWLLVLVVISKILSRLLCVITLDRDLEHALTMWAASLPLK